MSHLQKVQHAGFQISKTDKSTKTQSQIYKPFQHTGIDYTGHIRVQENRKSRKMYLLIFTCMNVQAIHIELVLDMSIRAFIQALIRFCNIHGASTHIYSDNARSFKTALGGDIIKHQFENYEFYKTYTSAVIRHINIPLYLPWFGSKWERLMRVIKSCLCRAKVEIFICSYCYLTFKGQ